MNKVGLLMVVGLAAGCGSGGKTEIEDDFSGLEAKSDRFAEAMRVVKTLGYGDRATTTYTGPKYSAFTFGGHKGDKVTIDVKSANGDAVAWLLSETLQVLAKNDDASDRSTDSHIDATLPATSSTYYIVLRDYYKASHRFEVALTGRSRTRTIELADEKCTDRNRFVPGGQIPTPEDIALDAFCAESILARSAPKGTVTIFGSSRLKDGTPQYANARNFASLWTAAHKDLPILTGGGPGLMEAGNRGAKEANGVSLGFSCYFKDANDKLNDYVTDGYVFSDFNVRERALLNYAKAAVVFPGGVGTAWELFMTLSEVQTHKLNKIPIVIVSKSMGDSFAPYIQWMIDNGTIAAEDTNLFVVVDTAADAITAIEAALPQ